MSKAVRAWILVAVVCVFASVASAHHGTTASYDQSRVITLKGTVVQFVWSNPHCQIYFDVKDKDGKVTHWGSELHSPWLLEHRGWSATVLKPGDAITVIGHPARSGSPVLEPLSVKNMETGKVYYREVPGSAAYDSAGFQQPGR
jgi:Family of unknown function (DUF6152)